MAETFLAVQHGSGGFEQRVCMKFMLPSLRNDRSFRQMFLREASIAASLRHTNIVGVIDVDDDAGYIVLELVDGVDLRTLVDAAPNRQLPAHLVSLVAVELCKALAYAHGRTRRGRAAGIVHRDISPSNVLVSHHGEVKLTDFGVAKAMHSVNEPPSAGIKGKLCYMSPEQTRGEALDGRSDLFSLGVMLYELACGKRPFDGPSDAQTLLRIEAGRHVPLVEVAPQVPSGLALVIERLLQREPESRYLDADSCIDALTRFAPPITAYRELGGLARAARPPVTLSTEDFGVITPGSGSRPLVDLEAARRSPDRTLRQPNSAEHDAVIVEPVQLSATSGARVSTRAWVALGASLLIAIAVSAAWIARLGPTPQLSTPPIATAPDPEPEPEPEVSPLVKPDIPPPQTFETPPAAAAATREPASPRPQPTPKAAVGSGAELRVGTVPLGQVWIDGELAGWAPVVINLPPGPHTIEGGNTKPEVKRSVRLRAGETRRLVLSLEEDVMGAEANGTHDTR